MKQTPAQHQREIDEADELDRAITREQADIEDEMREELLAGAYIEIRYRRGVAVNKEIFDQDNVIDAMIDLDSEGFNEAVMMIAAGKGRSEGEAFLEALLPRAVEQVIGLAKTREAAEYMMEQEDKAA